MAGIKDLKHSKGPYGENLCYVSSDPLNCVQLWYDEIKDYDFDNPGYSPETGHFTQLIWKESKSMGIGEHTADGTSYVVARYKPPGNVEGEFPDNVERARQVFSFLN
ncbi:hypothetical protein KR222_000773, partial [Zaprionus bogoriensis]